MQNILSNIFSQRKFLGLHIVAAFLIMMAMIGTPGQERVSRIAKFAMTSANIFMNVGVFGIPALTIASVILFALKMEIIGQALSFTSLTIGLVTFVSMAILISSK